MSSKIPELSPKQKKEIDALMPEFIKCIQDLGTTSFCEDYKFELRTKAGTLIITEFNEIACDLGTRNPFLFSHREGVSLDIDAATHKMLYYNWFCTHNNTKPKEVEFANIEDVRIFLEVLRNELDVYSSKE